MRWQHEDQLDEWMRQLEIDNMRGLSGPNSLSQTISSPLQYDMDQLHRRYATPLSSPQSFSAPSGIGMGGGTGASSAPDAFSGILNDMSGVAGAAGGTGAGSGGFLGTLGRILGMGNGIIPKLALGGLSLLGGDEQDDFRKPFTGQLTNPETNLNGLLSAIYRLGGALEQAQPPTLRSAVVPAGPAPVSFAGVQIGGGLGMDPALRDPSLLQAQWTNPMNMFQPFQGVAGNMFSQQPPPTQARVAQTRQRKPGANI